jgi:hypothetical protein
MPRAPDAPGFAGPNETDHPGGVHERASRIFPRLIAETVPIPIVQRGRRNPEPGIQPVALHVARRLRLQNDEHDLLVAVRSREAFKHRHEVGREGVAVVADRDMAAAIDERPIRHRRGDPDPRSHRIPAHGELLSTQRHTQPTARHHSATVPEARQRGLSLSRESGSVDRDPLAIARSSRPWGSASGYATRCADQKAW